MLMPLPDGTIRVYSSHTLCDAFFDVFFERLQQYASSDVPFLIELPAFVQTVSSEPLCFLSFRYMTRKKKDKYFRSIAFVVGRTLPSYDVHSFENESLFSYTDLPDHGFFVPLNQKLLTPDTFPHPICFAGFGSKTIKMPLSDYLKTDEARMSLKEQLKMFCSPFQKDLYLIDNYLSIFMQRNNFQPAMPPTVL